ncbi:two-component system histidine kinase PnpS [Macrococcus capreoli]|uniref:two-component system histidine kinase PnpS n=1 Tax=Macrococcus capreoli TaxID=2982690 RepID=UPI0021D5F044|nr:HAMP domain-containing sensor histidine kinase [Macrococcus sp. TMW 2.2395]MCU7558343.1 ATP-binding protein [Macrococcus sp. TMW 2.2395]
MLTTFIVVSFLLIGTLLHLTLADQLIKLDKATLTKDAQIFDAYVSGDVHVKALIKSYEESYKSSILILNQQDEILYKSDGITKQHFDNFIHKYTIKNDDKVNYRYEGAIEKSILRYKNKNTVYILSDNTTVNEIKSTIIKYFSYALLCMLPIIFIIVRYVNKSYIQPIKEVTYASRLLSEGNYKVRVPESSVTETKDLFKSTNILARTLQDLNNEQKLQRNRLETTLQNIPSATMLVNNHGEVAIANETYINLFNKRQPIEHGHYETVIDNKYIKQMIKEAIATEKPVNETLNITVNVHKKYFDVAVVPVLSKKRKKIEGIVIVLHDITQLKSLEQMRKDFVANVSHELKTPITSIKGFTETLIDGAKNEPETLNMFLDIILKESNRIQVLVSELLELSKIEQANHFEMSKVNLPQKVFNSVEVVHPLAEKKNIKFDLNFEKDLYVLAEPSKLKQVVINLLSNAINYSYDNATITVKVFQKDRNCILEITDEGIGIEPEEQMRIFERFYRVDKARSRDSGGTGLGLAIVKHIVEVFKGEIEVESEVGVGTTFRVILKQHLY